MGDGQVMDVCGGWGLAGSSTVPVVERLLLVGSQKSTNKIGVLLIKLARLICGGSRFVIDFLL